MNYLLKSVNTYRVPTEDAALNLRETLAASDYGALTAFTYKIKEVKVKGEVVDTYVVCSATLVFNPEKEPELLVKASYGLE